MSQSPPSDPYIKSVERLAAVKASGLLSPDREVLFERLATMALRLTSSPTVLLSIVDGTRQYFKVAHGLQSPWAERRETPLSHSLCQTVVALREPLLIEDITTHPELADHPSHHDLGVVAYCGVPLHLDGQVLGSFCVIDVKPRAWSAEIVGILEDLAHVIMSEVERRTEVARYAQAVIDRQEALDLLERTLFSVRVREEVYRSLVESSPDGIFWCDESGIITEVNGAGAVLLGATVDDLRGSRLAGFVAYEPDRTEPTQVREIEVTLTRDAAKARVLEVRVIPMGSGDHQVVLRDITQRRELEAQLRQAGKLELIGRLAGTVAHDFNNALVAVQGNVQLAMREFEASPPDLAEGRARLDDALSAVARGADIARQLLGVARKSGPSTGVVDLNSVVERATTLVERLLGPRVTVDIALAPGQHLVRASKVGLEQLLMNLATNARDVLTEGGNVLVETRRGRDEEHPSVELSFIDNGPGMSAEVRAQAFEPFFTTRPEGTGLGLFIVREVVEEAGGQLGVESNEGGTRFTITLPLAKAGQLQNPEPGSPPPEGHGERILVVDDDRLVRELVVRTLRRAGYLADEAQSVPDALQVLEGRVVDLVITDDRMPGMTGSGLVALLRQRSPSLPTILMTGYSVAEGTEVAEPSGRLDKPFDRTALLRLVAEILASQRSSIRSVRPP